MVELICEACGAAFEAKTKRSKYCKPACRTRKFRAPEAEDADPDIDSLYERPRLYPSTLAALDRMHRTDSVEGQAALVLAWRIDSLGSIETGSALASLIREHRNAMAAATAVAEPEADTIDEIAKRREERLKSGSAQARRR